MAVAAPMEHLQQVIESQKAIIASLQHENQWYQELFNNRTLSGTRMRIIAKTTPREIKMGLVDQVEEKKVYLPAMADEVGISDKILSKELRALAHETGAYTYRREDEENAAGLPVSRVILGYCPPLASPAQIELAPRGHGGKRVKRCTSCGSDQLVERKQTQCTCCGAIVDGPWQPVNEAEAAGGQDDPSENIEEEDSSCPPSTNPITPPQAENRDSLPTVKMTPGESVLIPWLEKRIGERIIYATGDLEQGRKYLYKPEGYAPDIAAYLAGDPEHIYGSRLRRADGTTWVLAFDFDDKQPEHDKNHVEYMTRLVAAGAAPIYFKRRPGRGHLELHFSDPVDPEAAYQWAIGIVPELAQVECFPCVGNQALSWPFYQRIGDQVTECSVEAMTPEKPDSMGRCKGIASDPARLAQIVTRCKTPASLVPALPIAKECTDATPGGRLLDKPLAYDGDLIDEFNRSHSWDDIAKMCGGYSRTGHFKAVWRGERTASVKPDKDERYCCDYGDGYRKYDKYGVWCKVKDIDPATDLREQRASMRQGVAA